MRRNPLLSHLSPTPPALLSKMSLAVLATFGAFTFPVIAADLPQQQPQTQPKAQPQEQPQSPQTTPSAPPVTIKPAEEPQPPFEDERKTTARAEQMTGRPERILNMDGQVQIVRGSSIVDANKAVYHAVDDVVIANGNVQMLRNGDCYSGDEFKMKMDTGEGYLTNPVYQLQKRGAQGFARRMNFIDNDQSVIEEGIYTTCKGTSPDWYLKSSRLDLDKGSDDGVATNGVVFFKEIPILGAPWLSFPISDARRSGVLTPEFASTTSGGPELMVPYYFNIAPNRDATIYPKYITKRGAQLGGEFRYLENDYSGVTHLEINPNDQETGTMRYSASIKHKQTLLPGLSMDLDYNKASDNQYAIDYSHSITASSQHLLPQSLALNYGQPFWNVGLQALNYQVLQDANNDIGTPYQIRPKVFAHTGKLDDFGGFDWSIDTEYANFVHPTLVNGERFVVHPQISYPIVGTYFFITPKIMYQLSDYKLGRGITAGTPVDQTLSVPTFSLDGGLFFEKETNYFGRAFTQTLEPRLFYVKTPYRSQSQIPLFDTAISDINFAQIFNENRFTGQDRVGDANQLTSALISRAIEADGQERIRFALAQRYSFTQPLVVDNSTFTSSYIQGNSTVYTVHSTQPSRSDLIFATTGRVTDDLTLDAVWEYSQSQQSTNQLTYGFKWQPGPMQVLNAEYRYKSISEVDTTGMKQIDVSAQWPLAPRWYGVARTNYSIQDKRVLDGLVGVEYKQDCWIFRFVAQRYVVTSTVANVPSSATTSLFFQLELNGLSKLGSNPLETLRRSILGYQPINQPQTQRNY